MRTNKHLKNVGLFIFLVILDIAVIQVFRYFTPRIILLRLGFIFLVLSLSILSYYLIIKPREPLKTGLILSGTCFLIALVESYIVHVVIMKEQYRLLFLLPCSFVLVLPLLLAVVYQKANKSKQK